MKSYFIFYQINRFLSSKQSNLIILVKLTIHYEKKKNLSSWMVITKCKFSALFCCHYCQKFHAFFLEEFTVKNASMWKIVIFKVNHKSSCKAATFCD